MRRSRRRADGKGRMFMRPRIGVLPLYNLEKQIFWINPLYLMGVEQAGGLPVLLPLSRNREMWDACCEGFDGFVFTGGQDVGPAHYGQERLPECGYEVSLRDNQELYMMRRLRELDKPVLGICRGVQVMNVTFGGALYQDLPAQRPTPVVHRQEMPFNLPHHQVHISLDSALFQLLGKEHLSVNSMHHQAIWTLAEGFRATAWAEDGLIEAIELPEARFFLGVQWHPEYMFQDYQSGRDIWRGLVEACAR